MLSLRLLEQNIKKTEVWQDTTNILKSIIGGKILSLTDMHGQGLRLRVICNNSNFVCKWVVVLKVLMITNWLRIVINMEFHVWKLFSIKVIQEKIVYKDYA